MDERVMQFRVGVMFLATLIITAILLVMFGKLPRYMGNYPIHIRFENAGGVTKDTPVRKSGILIGRVKDVELTDNDSRVLVTVDIQNDKTLYQNEDCYITRDLLGDTAMVFAPSSNRQLPRQPIDRDKTLEGRVSDDPTGLKRALEGPINTVQDTGRALESASNELKKAAEKINGILDSENQNIHDLLGNAAESLKAVRTVMGDEQTQKRLAQAMERLPDTLDSMNRTLTAADKSFKRFSEPGPDGRTTVDRMVGTIEMTEKTLTKFTQPRASGEPAPADQLANALSDIGEITTLLKSVVGRIERGDGSLGALLNDRDLYNHLNHAARNIEEVSQRLKPIVDDARVITDKVARHPGVIIRDAVKPGTGIK